MPDNSRSRRGSDDDEDPDLWKERMKSVRNQIFLWTKVFLKKWDMQIEIFGKEERVCDRTYGKKLNIVMMFFFKKGMKSVPDIHLQYS